MTSFGIFKFMIAYSLTEFLSVIILYSIDSNLTDLQFLFVDICLVVNFAFFFGKTQAFKGKLAKSPPSTSLLSFTPLFSLVLLMAVMTGFQVMPYYIVQHFSWFVPFKYTNETGYACYQNYSVFCASMFQYVTMAVVFSRGKPYRKAIYTNTSFIISISVLLAICVYITVYPAAWIMSALQLILPPDFGWRLSILAIACANFFVCLFVESFIIEFLIEKKLRPKFYRPDKSKKQYLVVNHYLKNNSAWPRLNSAQPILPTTPSVENMDKLEPVTKEIQSMSVESFPPAEEEHAEAGETGIVNNGFIDDEVDAKVAVITKC